MFIHKHLITFIFSLASYGLTDNVSLVQAQSNVISYTILVIQYNH